MATFALFTQPNAAHTKGTNLTKKADSIVLMGALVKKGSAAGDVAEVAANSDVVMGVSLYDEQTAFTNEADQYADNDVCVIQTLSSGQTLSLLNGGTASIAEGVQVEPSADGKIVAGTTNPIGVTNEVISGSARGEVIIQLR